MYLIQRLPSILANTAIRCRADIIAFIAQRERNKRPSILVFPSGGREGASLLRGYNTAEALRQRGWRSMVVPAVVKLPQRERIVRRFNPDLIYFQQCRHPLNDARLAFGRPYILDTDDADFHLSIPGLLNRLTATTRGAALTIIGSRYVRDWHRSQGANTSIIWTGTPLSLGPHRPHADRPPLIAWAQAKPLDYKDELTFVANIARHLHEAGQPFRLRFYGVADESEDAHLRSHFSADISIETLPLLQYEKFLRSLQEVAVGWAPLIEQSLFSRGKSFGKILGYLDAKVPVIASDAADHSIFFRPATGTVSNDLKVWVDSTTALLRDAGLRQKMADAAHKDFRARLSINAAADRVDKALRKVLEKSI